MNGLATDIYRYDRVITEAFSEQPGVLFGETMARWLKLSHTEFYVDCAEAVQQ